MKTKKKPKALPRDYMVARLMAWDIVSILQDLDRDDFGFLSSVMLGDGWMQYNSLTLDQVAQEYGERGESLAEMDASPFKYAPYVRQLLNGKL